MEAKEYKKEFVCSNCKKFSDNGFEIDLDRKFFNNIKVCRTCANNLYLSFGKCFVHKGIKNINKDIKIIGKDF